ncbi:hypothetical protein U1Q18_051693 [Sarracenia purpurea var. burkii]
MGSDSRTDVIRKQPRILRVLGAIEPMAISRHSVSEKYAELKFAEHSNPSSPYKVSGLTCNGNKAISPAIKVYELLYE